MAATVTLGALAQGRESGVNQHLSVTSEACWENFVGIRSYVAQGGLALILLPPLPWTWIPGKHYMVYAVLGGWGGGTQGLVQALYKQLVV